MSKQNKQNTGDKSTQTDFAVSRRDFLKGSALLGGTALAAGTLAACAPADTTGGNTTQTGSDIPTKWDKEVEVLAVGSSGAAYGALAAADAGATSVLLVEKNSMFGGTTSLSGGGHWIPCNFVMKAEGLEDNMDDAMDYLHYISRGQTNDELLRSYINNSNAFLEWTRENFGYVWDLLLGGTLYCDYGPDTVPGVRTKGRSLAINDVETVKAVTGEDIEHYNVQGPPEFQCVKYLAEQMGIEIQMNTAATKLYKNNDGVIVGAVIKSADGKEQNIGVSKGVILGTGGFDYNLDMCKRFLHMPYYSSMLVGTCTGDGHQMGLEVGAGLANMANVYGCAAFQPASGPLPEWEMLVDPGLIYTQIEQQRGKPNAIIVNRRGQRIGNESSAYALFAHALEAWDTSDMSLLNVPCYLIVDSTWTKYYGFGAYVVGTMTAGEVPDYVLKFDTIDAVADHFGIDKEGLKTQLAEFNANAAQGIDPIWHRGEFHHDRNSAGDNTGIRTDLKNNCLGPVETPPFYATPVYPGTLGTSGGLRINGKAQVLDVNDNVIPGLFACGCTAQSPFGNAYPGGGGPVGSTCTMGYVAGRVAMGADVR
jgi:succinate dehydrogenase/fumarate reductase flavoprotein subunit